MIITTKKQSATEAPKLASRAWDKIKSGAKSIWNTTKEVKNSLLNQPSEQTKQAMQKTGNKGWLGNKYNESEAREWNKEYSLLSDREKSDYIDNHLPTPIHSETRQELIKTLKGTQMPFTTSLYKLVVNHLARNMSKDALGIAIRNAQQFNEIFDMESADGLKLDNDGFQLKAIKYFKDRDTKFDILKDGRRWKSSLDMKKALDTDEEIAKDLKEGEANAKSKNRQSVEKIKLQTLRDFFKENPDHVLTKEFSGKSDEDLLEAYDGLKEIINSRFIRG